MAKKTVTIPYIVRLTENRIHYLMDRFRDLAVQCKKETALIKNKEDDHEKVLAIHKSMSRIAWELEPFDVKIEKDYTEQFPGIITLLQALREKYEK